MLRRHLLNSRLLLLHRHLLHRLHRLLNRHLLLHGLLHRHLLILRLLLHHRRCIEVALHLRLFEAADLVLDNMGVLGDACVAGTGGRMVGPTSTAVGASLLQAIVCRVEEIARERGQDVEYFASSNIDGGDTINAAYLEKYRGQIPAL